MTMFRRRAVIAVAAALVLVMGLTTLALAAPFRAVTKTQGRRLPATRMYLTTFGGGRDAQRGAFGHYLTGRTYYVALRFPVRDKRWWRNRKIYIYSPRTRRAVVARVQDWGPAMWVIRKAGRWVIDVSPRVSRDLRLGSAHGWSDRVPVKVYFASKNAHLGRVRVVRR